MKKLLFFSILMMAVLSVNYSLKEPRVNTLLLDNPKIRNYHPIHD